MKNLAQQINALTNNQKEELVNLLSDETKISFLLIYN